MNAQYYRKCKEGYSSNPSRCLCENIKYLKIVVDTSLNDREEIVIIKNVV